MTDRTQLFRSTRLTLISSAIMAALLGCQPATTEDSSATNATKDVAADRASKHDMHDNHGDEHADHDMTDEHSGHDHSEHDGHEGHDHSGHDHASKSEPFACEPEATISVLYNNDSMPQTAHLLIDGIEYDLEATSNNKNDGTQVYTSDIGLDNTHGIIWQAIGDNATLSNKTLDGSITIANETVIFNCQKVTD